MDELKINHQVVYYRNENRQIVSLNMLTFGCEQFASTTLFKNVRTLKQVCAELDVKPELNFNLVKEFAFNNLTDSIKITICFENFIKALLLANGFIIHKLDKTIFPALYKEQFTRPITFLEIKEKSDWEINQSIRTETESLKNQIKGITKFTIGMKELLGRGYLDPLEISDDVVDLFKPYFERRNDLHFYTGESFSITRLTYSNFEKVIDFINNHVVRIQNLIAEQLNIEQNKRIKPLNKH